jgi:hypothetical protein
MEVGQGPNWDCSAKEKNTIKKWRMYTVVLFLSEGCRRAHFSLQSDVTWCVPQVKLV